MQQTCCRRRVQLVGRLGSGLWAGDAAREATEGDCEQFLCAAQHDSDAQALQSLSDVSSSQPHERPGSRQGVEEQLDLRSDTARWEGEGEGEGGTYRNS